MKIVLKWLLIAISVVCIAYTALVFFTFYFLQKDDVCHDSPVISATSPSKEFKLLHERVKCEDTPFIGNNIYLVDEKRGKSYIIYQDDSMHQADYGMYWVSEYEIELLIPAFIEIYNSKTFEVRGYSIKLRNMEAPIIGRPETQN